MSLSGRFGSACSSHVRSARTSTPSISLLPRPVWASSSGRSASSSGNLSLRAMARNSARISSAALGREERDVHVETALPLQIDLEQIGTRGGEHPQDAPAVARVATSPWPASRRRARQPAVAVAALALARRLIGLVDEHDDLADRVQHREDLLEVRLGRADPPIAEVLEDDAGDAELARPSTARGTSCPCRSARQSDTPSGARAARPSAAARIVTQPRLDGVAARRGDRA